MCSLLLHKQLKILSLVLLADHPDLPHYTRGIALCKGSWGKPGGRRQLQQTQMRPQKCLVLVQRAFFSNSLIHQHYYLISCKRLDFCRLFKKGAGLLLCQFGASRRVCVCVCVVIRKCVWVWKRSHDVLLHSVAFCAGWQVMGTGHPRLVLLLLRSEGG